MGSCCSARRRRQMGDVLYEDLVMAVLLPVLADVRDDMRVVSAIRSISTSNLSDVPFVLTRTAISHSFRPTRMGSGTTFRRKLGLD